MLDVIAFEAEEDEDMVDDGSMGNAATVCVGDAAEVELELVSTWLEYWVTIVPKEGAGSGGAEFDGGVNLYVTGSEIDEVDPETTVYPISTVP
jgi:hypothetical protein